MVFFSVFLGHVFCKLDDVRVKLFLKFLISTKTVVSSQAFELQKEIMKLFWINILDTVEFCKLLENLMIFIRIPWKGMLLIILPERNHVRCFSQICAHSLNTLRLDL
jgi:hypothetical protein